MTPKKCSNGKREMTVETDEHIGWFQLRRRYNGGITFELVIPGERFVSVHGDVEDLHKGRNFIRFGGTTLSKNEVFSWENGEYVVALVSNYSDR